MERKKGEEAVQRDFTRYKISYKNIFTTWGT